MKKVILKAFLLTIAATATFSCGSSTKVSSSWETKTPSPDLLTKILVLGLAQERELRDQMEIALTQQLKTNGVNATSAIEIFGPGVFRSMKQEYITSRLDDEGFTSVIFVVLAGKEQNVEVIPTESAYARYNPYTGRYMYLYDRMYQPSYYTTSSKYILYANIYSRSDHSVIYSAKTVTAYPTSVSDMSQLFISSIAKELGIKGYLQ